MIFFCLKVLFYLWSISHARRCNTNWGEIKILDYKFFLLCNGRFGYGNSLLCGCDIWWWVACSFEIFRPRRKCSFSSKQKFGAIWDFLPLVAIVGCESHKYAHVQSFGDNWKVIRGRKPRTSSSCKSIAVCTVLCCVPVYWTNIKKKDCRGCDWQS